MNFANILIGIFGLISFITFLKAVQECRNNKNSFGKTPKICDMYGSFVWADQVIFGLFWSLVSLFCIILQDYILFLLIFSVFWLVRSIGETIYWFLQQFHPRGGNEPEKFLMNKIIKGEAMWFVNQIFWQCVTVITLISSVYLFSLWLK